MGTAVPVPINVKALIPAYKLVSVFSGFTDWRLDVVLETTGAPFIKVAGANTVSVALNEPTENASGQMVHEVDLTYSFYNLNVLSAGNYYCYFKYRISALKVATGVRENITENLATMFFEVKTAMSPYLIATWESFFGSPLAFSFNLGGNLPIPKPVALFHNVATFDLTCDSPLISWEIIHSDHYSLVMVQFENDINGLSPGLHNFTITITSGALTQTVPVSLNVGETTAPFYASPDQLNFTVYQNASFINTKMVTIMSQNNWEIVGGLPSWLAVSQTTGGQLTELYVSLSGVNTMMPGDYSFSIEFRISGTSYYLPVYLTVNNYLNHPYIVGGIYFTESLDYLVFNTGRPNNYIDLTIEIESFDIDTYIPKLYTRVFKLPLYDGKGDFHIGSVVEQLFDEIKTLSQAVPDLENTFTSVQYKPSNVTVAFVEKSFLAGEVLQMGEIPAFKMIRGQKPYLTAGGLGILSVAQSEPTRITPTSNLGVTFTHLGTPYILVKKNGVVIEEYNLVTFPSGQDKILYSYFRLNNNGLKPGDSLEVDIRNGYESRSRRFIVLPEGKESTNVYFENNNGVVEVFEFTGRRRLNSTYTHTVNRIYRELFETDKKVDSENSQSWVINTGNLLPSDHKIIDAIIKSRNVWVILESSQGAPYKANVTTTKLVNLDTDSPDTNFDIEFTILENANAKIYIQ